MRGGIYAASFILAERLGGMTAAELRKRMYVKEVTEWSVYDKVKEQLG